MEKMILLDEEEFLFQKGFSSPISDWSLDKLKGNRQLKTMKGQNRFLKAAFHEADVYYQKRNAFRQDYKTLVEQGMVRPRTLKERAEIISKGNPELQSTQAAQRILDKLSMKKESLS